MHACYLYSLYLCRIPHNQYINKQWFNKQRINKQWCINTHARGGTATVKTALINFVCTRDTFIPDICVEFHITSTLISSAVH